MTTTSTTAVQKYAVVDERRFTIDARCPPYVCNEYVLARVVYVNECGTAIKNGVVLVTFPFASPGCCCWERSVRRNNDVGADQSASTPTRTGDLSFLGVSFCSARWLTDQVRNDILLPVTSSTCAVFYSTTDRSPHDPPVLVTAYLRSAPTSPYILASVASAALSVLASEVSYASHDETTSSSSTSLHVLDATKNPPLLFKVPVVTDTPTTTDESIIRRIAKEVKTVIGAALENPVLSRDPAPPDAFFCSRLFQRMMRLVEVQSSRATNDEMLVDLVRRCATASEAVSRERARANGMAGMAGMA